MNDRHADSFMPYRGRFAPSPTGFLHMGSLMAAMASYLEAKKQQGQWGLRIEDIDVLRTVPGSADSILQTLEKLGFMWDGPVVYQSQRVAGYQEILAELIQTGRVYACGCSRKEIAAISRAGVDGYIYPGTCRSGLASDKKARMWRFRVENKEICFRDAIQGLQKQNVEQAVGDFTVLRADGCFSYQLAVVADDEAAGITHIVRGADLLDSTPRQIALQRALNYTTPYYAHIPVVVNKGGMKLSKHLGAQPLEQRHPAQALWQVLYWLGQMPPDDLALAPVQEIWAWAFLHWDMRRISACRTVTDV